MRRDPLVGVFFGVRWGSSSLGCPLFFSSLSPWASDHVAHPHSRLLFHIAQSPHHHCFCSVSRHVVTVSLTAPLAFFQFLSHVSPAVLAALQFLRRFHTAKWERGQSEGPAGKRESDQSCSSNWSGSGLLRSTSSSLPVSPPTPSLLPPLPVGSQFRCVLLPSVPPLLTRPRSPSSHSVSIFLSELTSYCRSVDHGLGRLDAKPYLPRVSVSKKVWNFLNGSNLWKDTGIPAAQERLIVEMVCLRWVTCYHSLFVDQ